MINRLIPGVVVVAAAVAAALLPLAPEGVERWFSAGIYPLLQAGVTSATNLVPFALFDLLLIVASVALVATLARGISAARRLRHFAPLGRAVFAIVSAAAVGYLVFLGVWGLNYRRVPLPRRLVLDQRPAQNDAVVALGLDAVRELNRLYADAHRRGWDEPEWRNATLTSSAAKVHTELTGVRPAVAGRLKPSLLGPYFRWTGVDGMVNPFGLEVIGNPDLLPFERPFVAAHEWGHLAGFADESEANFVGFLTCVRAGVAEQYSGWLYLYWQVAGETDAAGRTRLWEEMSEGPRADVQAILARLRAGELPRLRLASWLVYDQYLKANRVESGVRSYGQVVNLLVRAKFGPGWVPMRAPLSTR